MDISEKPRGGWRVNIWQRRAESGRQMKMSVSESSIMVGRVEPVENNGFYRGA